MLQAMQHVALQGAEEQASPGSARRDPTLQAQSAASPVLCPPLFMAAALLFTCRPSNSMRISSCASCCCLPLKTGAWQHTADSSDCGLYVLLFPLLVMLLRPMHTKVNTHESSWLVGWLAGAKDPSWRPGAPWV